MGCIWEGRALAWSCVKVFHVNCVCAIGCRCRHEAVAGVLESALTSRRSCRGTLRRRTTSTETYMSRSCAQKLALLNPECRQYVLTANKPIPFTLQWVWRQSAAVQYLKRCLLVSPPAFLCSSFLSTRFCSLWSLSSRNSRIERIASSLLSVPVENRRQSLLYIPIVHIFN